jgi:hypothetical protein
MGEVYRADDLKLGLPVALKFLPENLATDPTWLARLHNEVRTAREVTPPFVCRVHDIGEAGGLHFISMEYVDGEDLASLLRRIGRLPRDKGIAIARQLCAGLAAAHDRGVLHRDQPECAPHGPRARRNGLDDARHRHPDELPGHRGPAAPAHRRALPAGHRGLLRAVGRAVRPRVPRAPVRGRAPG